MGKTKFTISLLGFDDRSADTLAHATRATMNIVNPINHDETQVVVVDIDDSDDATIWKEFREQWPHMPAVVVCSEDPHLENVIFTEKPFTSETLIDNITEAIILAPTVETPTGTTTDITDQEIESELIGDVIEIDYDVEAKEESAENITATDTPATEDTIDTDNKMQPLSELANVLSSQSSKTDKFKRRTLDSPNPDEIFFNPDAHIISLVLKGVAEGQKTGAIAKLACLLDKTIYIDAQNNIISSNLKDIHMRQIGIAPLGDGESGLEAQLEMIDSKSIEELSDSDSSIYPAETFIWELALLTSKGRVPVGTPMDKPTYLMQWPNFTRLKQTPNDMKIAAYWLRMPSSLTDLSENLDIPMNNVCLMYAATYLTGLAGLATRKSDNMLKPSKPEKHHHRPLFGSIMQKFKK